MASTQTSTMRVSRDRPAWRPVLGWMILAAAIGYVDFATGPFFSLTLFYLLPVVGAGWTGGRVAGVIVALTAGLASFVSDIVLLPQAASVPLFWNTGSRTVVLVVATVAIDIIRRDRDHLRSLDEQRARSLQLLDQGLAGPARQIAELVDRWDGSLDALRQALRPRADEIRFLAQDFSTMIRLQSGELKLSIARFDLTDLIDELRAELTSSHKIMLMRPAGPLYVLGDRPRSRQAFAALIALAAERNEVSVSLAARQSSGEVVLTSAARWEGGRTPGADEIGLTLELAQLLISAQGGTIETTRNPITRTFKITAHLPLA